MLATAALLNGLLTKTILLCSSFNILSTDASFIKIGVWYSELSSLEFNFHTDTLDGVFKLPLQHPCTTCIPTHTQINNPFQALLHSFYPRTSILQKVC